MPTPDPRAGVLADALETTLPLFTRFLSGFSDDNHTHQAHAMPNHAAWTLGHLALYHHRATDRLLGHDAPQPLPESDFIEGDGRSGTPTHVDTESVCYASVPVDDPSIYPSFDRLLDIHHRAWSRLVETTRSADSAMLDRMVPWGNTPFPADALVVRMMMHMGTHAGQITDLRRGLGMPSVIG
ncbi:MAG: DinB family protein [Phycisphaerales bacterium]|nr:DinB family protein [Phycisphaerales bacterium]